MKTPSPIPRRKRRGVTQIIHGDTIVMGNAKVEFKGEQVRLESVRCCDCGLTHLWIFNRAVKMQVLVDTISTRLARRSKKVRKRVAEVAAKVKRAK